MGAIRIRIKDTFHSEAHAGCQGTWIGMLNGWCLVHLNGAPEFELLKVRRCSFDEMYGPEKAL